MIERTPQPDPAAPRPAPLVAPPGPTEDEGTGTPPEVMRAQIGALRNEVAIQTDGRERAEVRLRHAEAMLEERDGHIERLRAEVGHYQAGFDTLAGRIYNAQVSIEEQVMALAGGRDLVEALLRRGLVIQAGGEAPLASVRGRIGPVPEGELYPLTSADEMAR